MLYIESCDGWMHKEAYRTMLKICVLGTEQRPMNTGVSVVEIWLVGEKSCVLVIM